MQYERETKWKPVRILIVRMNDVEKCSIKVIFSNIFFFKDLIAVQRFEFEFVPKRLSCIEARDIYELNYLRKIGALDWHCRYILLGTITIDISLYLTTYCPEVGHGLLTTQVSVNVNKLGGNSEKKILQLKTFLFNNFIDLVG